MASIYVSLDDLKIKEIAEVITNKTCIKILDYLADKEKTVSEISTELKLPINTVDYNIKKLVKSGFIEKKSFWWSTKGKKMPSYVVSNKQIIINANRRNNKLKYLLSFIITGAFSIFIKIFAEKPKFVKTVRDVGQNIITREGSMEQVAKLASENVVQASSVTYYPFFGFSFWFLVGAWSVILLFFLISIISERRLENEKRSK